VAKADVVTDWNITAGDNPCRVSIQPLESVHGTFETWRLYQAMSAFKDNPEVSGARSK
jgi:hypothetical protein